MKSLIYKVRTNFKLRQLLQLAITTVCFLIGCWVVYQNEIEPRKQDAYTVDPVGEEEEFQTTRRLSDGDRISQDLIYNNDQMIGIGVMLYSDSDENAGRLHLTLTDTETNELLGETDYELAPLTDMRNFRPQDEKKAYANVGMPTILEHLNGRALTLTVEAFELSETTGVSLYMDRTGENVLVRGYCYLYNFWELYFRVFAVLLYLLLIVSYLMFFVLETPLRRVFAFAGLILGITYNFLLPPVAATGEATSFLNAYHTVNEISGISGDSENITVMRETDAEAFAALKEMPDLKEYAYIHWNLLRRPRSTELTTYEADRKSGSNPIAFVSGLFGVGLGRAAGLNGITTLYLARFFAFVIYFIIFYLLLRFLPVCQGAVLIFALTPAAFQCFATLSRIGEYLSPYFTGQRSYIGNGIDLNPFWSFAAFALFLLALLPTRGEKRYFRPGLFRLEKPITAQLVFLMLADQMFFINNILSSTKMLN